MGLGRAKNCMKRSGKTTDCDFMPVTLDPFSHFRDNPIMKYRVISFTCPQHVCELILHFWYLHIHPTTINDKLRLCPPQCHCTVYFSRWIDKLRQGPLLAWISSRTQSISKMDLCSFTLAKSTVLTCLDTGRSLYRLHTISLRYFQPFYTKVAGGSNMHSASLPTFSL